MTALSVLPSIPIAKVGTWKTATGEWVCTAVQLASAVSAQHDPAFRNGVIKIGHTDPRFTDGEVCGDGEPAIGRLENLRLTDDGQTLLADFVGMPAWLADIAASAFPSRSVEALLDVTTPDGATYAMVVTGCALLGVQAPAIESLGDIADLFGVSRDVTAYTVAARVAASALPEGENPMPRALGQVVASASIDELAAAAEEWAEENPILGDGTWVRDIYTDTVVFCNWRGDDPTYWRVQWQETNGVFTFGTPEQVRPNYEPVPTDTGTGDAEGAADMMVASRAPKASSLTSARVLGDQTSGTVRSVRGRDVTAGAHPEENHVPISPALAAALGVAEDADDETALAALATLRAPAATEPPAQQATQEGGNTDTAPTDMEALVAARVASEVQRVTAPLLGQIETLSGQVAASRAAEVATTRAQVITAALRDGKIRPAERAQWEADYDANPDLITSVIARMAKGTAVPVAAAGHVGGEEPGGDEELWASLYGTSEKAGA